MFNSIFYKKHIRPTIIKLYAKILNIPFNIKHQWVKLKYGKSIKDLPVEVLIEEYKDSFKNCDLTAAYIIICGELDLVAKLCGREITSFRTGRLLGMGMNGHYLTDEESNWLASILYANNTREALLEIIFILDLSPAQLQFYTTAEFQQWVSEGTKVMNKPVSVVM